GAVARLSLSGYDQAVQRFARLSETRLVSAWSHNAIRLNHAVRSVGVASISGAGFAGGRLARAVISPGSNNPPSMTDFIQAFFKGFVAGLVTRYVTSPSLASKSEEFAVNVGKRLPSATGSVTAGQAFYAGARFYAVESTKWAVFVSA